jgi:hypothetical protein
MEPLNNEVVMETFPRSDSAPKSSEVGHFWPYPQFAEKKKADFGPSDTWGVDETFPRSSAAPQSAEVSNWPFPQFHSAGAAPANASNASAAARMVQNNATAPAQALVQKNEPSPDYGIDERFPRPDKAPSGPTVIGWPSLAEADKNDVAANKYVNMGVHKLASPHVEETPQFNRPAAAPKSAEVKGWPYPQYAQEDQHDVDIAKNEHINPDVFGLANPHVPEKAEANRQSGPPKSAEVKNWPFPQYAQGPQDQNPIDGRRSGAPTSAEVAGWPYPQWVQVDQQEPPVQQVKEEDLRKGNPRPPAAQKGVEGKDWWGAESVGYQNPDFHRKSITYNENVLSPWNF